MAISSACIWEIRATATAGNVNGGGFVPGGGGTDYSQQDAAQYTFSDLASTNGTTNPAVVSSASHSFVAADVGNIMHITAGTSWTAGFYQIVSVAGGNATLDKACGSAATLSAGTYFVGGALSLGSATSDTTWAAAIAAGNTVWVKSGTISIGSTVTLGSGSSGVPCTLSGYNATRGDNPTGANRPIINCGTTFQFVAGSLMNVSNLIFTGSNATVFTTGASSIISNVKAICTSTTAGRVAMNASGLGGNILNCEAISYRGIACKIGNQGNVVGCYFHDSDKGVQISTASYAVLAKCIISNNVTSAIDYTGASTNGSLVMSNTLYGSENKTGIGVAITTGAKSVLYLNNNISGFATGISDGNGGTGLFNFADYNNLFNNTTNYVSITGGSGSKTLNPAFAVTQLTGTAATTSGSVLTDASQNFSNVVDNVSFLYLVSGTGVTAGQYLITAHTATTVTLDIAPGTSAVADKRYQVTLGNNFAPGRALIGTDFPNAFPAGLTTTYGEIGAAQRQIDADYTDPGIDNVRDGTTYTFQNSTQTGDLVVPLVATVKAGTTYGTSSGLTGTYDGSDRWSDPGVDNVRNGTAYKANSFTNNRTGDLVVPTASQVKSGTTFESSGGTTGTYDGSDRWTDPGQTNVRNATAYKANSLTNNKTGSLVVPSVGNVHVGTTFDNGSVGTYTGADRWSDPGIANVKSGVSYKADSTSDNKTGVYDIKPVPQYFKNSIGIDGTDHLNGAFWITLDGAIITSSLGSFTYDLLNSDGTSTGISETISPVASGLFFITPVDVTSLVGTPNLILKMTGIYLGVTFIDYVEFSLATSSGGGGGSTDLTPVQTVVDAIKVKTDAYLDATVSSRLATSGYTAPDNTSISAIKTTTDANLDATVSSRLATSGYTAPSNTSIAAIKAKTDNLPASPAATSDVTTAETAVLTAIGSPLQTGDTRLNHLDADISSVATGGVPVDAIADAVWSSNLADHTTSGTFGWFIQKLLTIGKFLGLQ